MDVVNEDRRRELQRLLRKAANPGLPSDSLQAIRRLRQLVDELELDSIRAARSNGATWRDIAEWVGVTRQALHQRVGRVMKAEGQVTGAPAGDGRPAG